MSVKGKQKRKKRVHSASESGSDSEHELFYYRDDRVRLMKQVLKILKLKKIKSLAPEGIKQLDMEEINTMLLEELLGISNKRLKKILEGQSADDESSSSDEDKVDIISLDSISDDEIMFIDEKKEENPSLTKPKCRHKKCKVKLELQESEVKTEKESNSKVKKEKEYKKEMLKLKTTKGLENEKLLSVLELLELQARARAIRSQLALEAENKAKEAITQNIEIFDNDDDDAVIIETPLINEIVISSSSDSEQDSETPIVKNIAVEHAIVEDTNDTVVDTVKSVEIVCSDGRTSNEIVKICNEVQQSTSDRVKKTQKIKLIRSIVVEPAMQFSKIPLPMADNPNSECSKTTWATSPTVDDDKNEIAERSDNTEVDETLNSDKKEAEASKEIDAVHVHESVETIDSQVDQSDSKDAIDNDGEANKKIVVSDNEDDVIRLDIVEIDGIDY